MIMWNKFDERGRELLDRRTANRRGAPLGADDVHHAISRRLTARQDAEKDVYRRAAARGAVAVHYISTSLAEWRHERPDPRSVS